MATAGVKLRILSEKHRFRAAVEYMHINYHRSVAFIFCFRPESRFDFGIFYKNSMPPESLHSANTAAREVEPLGVDIHKRGVLPAMDSGASSLSL